jgi:tRNA modification GTPase
MTDISDTIAAVSTPMGIGGIAIIRVSGPEAESVTRKVFRPGKAKFPLESHKMHFGRVVDPETGNMIDQVLCCFMPEPHSYTRENVVEFHCHGGAMAAGIVLDVILTNGARLAEPGEFTKRAFLAGRIDLTEAEAVAEMIAAKSRAQAEVAAAQLNGGLRETTKGLAGPLVEILAHLETALDFPDEEADIINYKEASHRVENDVLKRLDKLLIEAEQGRAVKEGLNAAIVGRPNVGKSSLLNALSNAEKAIVADLPGTTRDVIEVDVLIMGIPVMLVDTAGLSVKISDQVELEGQRRARNKMAEADIVFVVLDGSRPLDDEDKGIIGNAPPERTFVVINKADLPEAFKCTDVTDNHNVLNTLKVSAKFGTGLDQLRTQVYQHVTKGKIIGQAGVSAVIPGLRHKKALMEARESIIRAITCLQGNEPPEIIALEIRDGLEKLGEITGKTTSDDVLDAVFSRFCLGK